MNEQREVIYAERRKVLDGESMRETIFKMATDFIENVVDMCLGDDVDSSEWDLTELNQHLLATVPIKPVTEEDVKDLRKNQVKQNLKEEVVKFYEAKETEFPSPDHLREIERVVLLKTVDRKWMDHIDDMEQLRQGIGLQAYGQRDPVVEYKMAGFDMFDGMIAGIQEDTVRTMMHIKIEQEVKREQVATPMATNKDDSAVRAPKKRADKKVYPNDPCPCGSGKKYKQCCGR